jgi:2-phospho-L-lactate guanylyltransferase (CobY/MobA/RfbA family)
MAEEDEADALSALEEVVRVFREPAVLSPDAHLANEAMALNTLADDLHTGGRLAEAVATARKP